MSSSPSSALASIVALAALVLSNASAASDDGIAFPANYRDWVLYATYNEAGNRPELLATGQLRELYATKATLDAAKTGGPLPDGTVLVRVRYDVVRGANGEPIQDAQGRMTKARLLGFGVMQKRQGAKNAHLEGEWVYRGFTADGKPNAKGIQPAACFECHRAAKQEDFVFSYDRMVKSR
jgi:hypothetical protein